MQNWQIKKFSEIIVGIIFIYSAIFLFYKAEYGWGVLLLLSLLILLKLDVITEFAFNPRDGFQAKFQPSIEKIKEDIKENKEEVTQNKIQHYKDLEIKFLKKLHKKLGGMLTGKLNFIYGYPDKPEFRFQPDATIQVDETIIFIEVKHVLHKRLANHIIEDGLKQLQTVLEKFQPSSPDKKLKAMLMILSPLNIDKSNYFVPKNIEIDIYKI
ncbi:hypothetical protein D4R87_00420 [bacterium]|nr:MAG: hypothetical protein D4R87_00420 [bacterium]